MLLKNEVKMDVPKGELTTFNATGKRIIFRLMPNFFYWDELNKRRKAPASKGIDLEYSYYDEREGIMVSMRYCTNITPQANGGKKYTPDALYFDHQNGYEVSVEQNNPELWYFLINHPQRKDSKFRNLNKEEVFYIEDKKAVAIIELEKTRSRKVCYDKVDSLEERGMRELAKALQHYDTDNMSKEEVLAQLYQDIEADAKRVLYHVGDAKTPAKALAATAIEMGLIKFDGKHKTWFFVKDNGDNGEKIVGVMPSMDRNEKLAEVIAGNHENIAGILETMIKAKQTLLVS